MPTPSLQSIATALNWTGPLDVTAQNRFGKTLLQVAVEESWRDSTKEPWAVYLLEQGASSTPPGSLSLLSISNHSPLIFKAMLDHGAPLQSFKSLPPHELLPSLFQDLQSVAKYNTLYSEFGVKKVGGQDLVQKLVDIIEMAILHGARFSEKSDSWEWVIYGCMDAQLPLSMFRQLISIGFPWDKPEELNEYPVLNWAITGHRPELVTWLLSQGFDINKLGEFMESPLHAITIEHHQWNHQTKAKPVTRFLEYLDLLQDKQVNWNLEGQRGFTPIKSLLFSYPQHFDRLIQQGADINHQNEEGNSALHEWCLHLDAMSEYEFDQFLEKLDAKGAPFGSILDLGFEVNAVNTLGETPLFNTSNPILVEELLRHGADPSWKNKAGQTPMELYPHVYTKPYFIALLATLEKEKLDASLSPATSPTSRVPRI